MSVTVTYDLSVNSAYDKNSVISEIRRDISSGTFIDPLSAAKNTLGISGSLMEPWKKYTPELIDGEGRTNEIKLIFHNDQFNFPQEGINHFIGTIAGDVIRNSKLNFFKITDVEFEGSSLSFFPGPKSGVEILKSHILGDSLNEQKRPILAFSIKPRIGMSIKEYKKIIFDASESGIDIIEDDERLVDPVYCSFDERIKVINTIKDQTKSKFSINLTGNPYQLPDKVRSAYNLGIRIFKLDVTVSGFDVLLKLRELLDSFEEPTAITVFPDVYGSYYRNIERNVILKLARLCGADIIYAGSPAAVSRMGDIKDEGTFFDSCSKLLTTHKQLLRTLDNGRIKSCLPTITHDISPEMLERIIFTLRLQGDNHTDYAFFIGGGISGFPSNDNKNVTISEACSVWMNVVSESARKSLVGHSIQKLNEICGFQYGDYESSLRKIEWHQGYFKQCGN